jgi:predicted amidohydrolase
LRRGPPHQCWDGDSLALQREREAVEWGYKLASDGMRETVRVAAAQMNCKSGDHVANMAKIESYCVEARNNAVDLICFPELSVCGYVHDQNSVELAEDIPGVSTSELTRIARAAEVTVLAGLLEKDPNGRIYNTHVIVSSDGVIGKQRKIHVAESESDGFSPGDYAETFESRGVRFGIEICYDAHFPELSTHLALRGAEIIFMPHASAGETYAEKLARWSLFLPARAYDNSVYVVVCNQTGSDGAGHTFPGVSFIRDPLGSVLAESDGPEEQLVIATCEGKTLLDVQASGENYYLGHRRSKPYDPLPH